jgi:hypothetical protein
VQTKFAAFETVDAIAVLPSIKARINALQYRLLRPVDLDSLMEDAPSVRRRFFKTHLVIGVDEAGTMISRALDENATLARITDLAELIERKEAPSALGRELLDREVERKIEALRRARFFQGVDVSARARLLSERLIMGNLVQASDAVRARAIALCAR